MLWGIRFRDELDRPDELINLIHRLQFEPWSLYRAKVLGGDEWMGWDRTSALLATLIDMTGFQTQATAVNKKAKFKALIERPEAKKRVIKAKTVAELTRMVAGR